MAALKPASLFLCQHVEQELTALKARVTELQITYKVMREFAENEVEAVEPVTNGAETKRIILRPTDDVSEAVKSRLVEHISDEVEIADETFELVTP